MGTDTGVGKTYVAALVARELAAAGHRVGVYKPVASGCRDEAGRLVSDDALALWEAAGRPGTLEQVCPQRFVAPLAPSLAARAEGRQVDAAALRRGIEYWQANSDVVLVEGAGGLMSPVSDEDYMADLAYDLGYPLLVVTSNQLGTINRTLLTLIVAAAYGEGLDVAGLVLNTPAVDPHDASRASNGVELAARCVPPLLAEVAYGGRGLVPPVDWFALARPAVVRTRQSGEW